VAAPMGSFSNTAITLPAGTVRGKDYVIEASRWAEASGQREARVNRTMLRE
jgi:hypothetical protein